MMYSRKQTNKHTGRCACGRPTDHPSKTICRHCSGAIDRKRRAMKGEGTETKTFRDAYVLLSLTV